MCLSLVHSTAYLEIAAASQGVRTSQNINERQVDMVLMESLVAGSRCIPELVFSSLIGVSQIRGQLYLISRNEHSFKEIAPCASDQVSLYNRSSTDERELAERRGHTTLLLHAGIDQTT